MQGNSAAKKFLSAFLALSMTISLFGALAVTADNNSTSVNDVDEGRLIFKGLHLKTVAGGGIQALVQVCVDNVNATGIDFELKYNNTYLVPSNYDTNVALTSSDDVKDAVKPNPVVFTEDSPMMFYSDIGDGLSVLDTSAGKIQLNLSPSPNSVVGGYIGEDTIGSPVEKTVKYVKAGDELLWATISFTVLKPFAVANMTESQLLEILNLTTDVFGDDNAYISYVDDKNLEFYVGPKIPVKWEVESTLDTVEAQPRERSVTAYKLYGQSSSPGTTEDIMAYINDKMTNVTEYYTDGQSADASIFWNSSATITIVDSDGNETAIDTYDPKGGVTYKITQNYLDNPKFPVTIYLEVTRSELRYFEYDRKSITYDADNRPQDWGDLLLPPVIRPVVSGVDDLYVRPADKPDGYIPDATPEALWDPDKWSPSVVTDALKNNAPVAETYTHTYDKNLLGTPPPAWMTIAEDFNWNIEAYRYVMPEGFPQVDPDGVTADVDRKTGNLIINIPSNVFGGILNYSGVGSDADFIIYLSSGDKLSTDSNSDFVEKKIKTDKSVQLIVKSASAYKGDGTDSFKDSREFIQSLINSGSSDFSVSMVYDYTQNGTTINDIESTSVPFTFSPRVNYYLEDGTETMPGGTDRKYIKKDYSEGHSSGFNMYEGDDISGMSTYMKFPDHSTINVAYNGQSGYQKPFVNTSAVNTAVLDDAYVDSWWLEDINGNNLGTTILPSEGTTLYIVGKLVKASYTNFGIVYNPEEPVTNVTDEVYLKLKITTLASSIIPGSTTAPSPTPTPEPTYLPGTTTTPEPAPTYLPGTTTTPEPAPTYLPGTTTTPEPAPTYLPGTTTTPEPPTPSPAPTYLPGTTTTPEPAPTYLPGTTTTPEPAPTYLPGTTTTPEPPTPSPAPTYLPGTTTTPEPAPTYLPGTTTTPEPAPTYLPGTTTTPEPAPTYLPGTTTTPEPAPTYLPGTTTTPEPPTPSPAPTYLPGTTTTPEPAPTYLPGTTTTPEPAPTYLPGTTTTPEPATPSPAPTYLPGTTTTPEPATPSPAPTYLPGTTTTPEPVTPSPAPTYLPGTTTTPEPATPSPAPTYLPGTTTTPEPATPSPAPTYLPGTTTTPEPATPSPAPTYLPGTTTTPEPATPSPAPTYLPGTTTTPEPAPTYLPGTTTTPEPSTPSPAPTYLPGTTTTPEPSTPSPAPTYLPGTTTTPEPATPSPAPTYLPGTTTTPEPATPSPAPTYLPGTTTTPEPATPSPAPTYLPGTTTTPEPATPSPAPTYLPGTTTTPDPNATLAPTTEPTSVPTATPIPKNKIEISTDVSGAETIINKATFQYDSKQVYYTTYQRQTFKIKNVGSNNLTGLNIRIENFKLDGADMATANFYLEDAELYSKDASGAVLARHQTSLDVGDELYVDIRTLLNLYTPGTYTARVVLGTSGSSDSVTSLDYFDITFTITAGPVYQVEIQNDDTSIGYGLLTTTAPDGTTIIHSSTYTVGETVNLKATVVDPGYSFKEWEIVSNDDLSTDSSYNSANATTSFTMITPDDSVKIILKPVFEETYDVWVRLADLRSYNTDDLTQNQLRDSVSLSATTFNEATYSYSVIVDGSHDEEYVEFDVKDNLLTSYLGTNPISVTMTLTNDKVTNDPVTVTNTSTAGTVANTTTFKSDNFNIEEGANVVTITTKYVDDHTNPSNPITYTKTYTLTIYRKNAVKVDMIPGNSPYGLIDGSPNFAGDSDAAKAARQAAKDHFSAEHTFAAFDTLNNYVSTYMPDYAANTYDTKYYTNVWGSGKNYDEDSDTLFVYSGEQFVDPGFENLEYIDGSLVDPDDVTRKIENVYTYDASTVTDMASLVAAMEAATNIGSVTVSNTGESVLITELASLKVRPGIYSLKYNFTDSDGSDASFSRPLVILARKGDVNLSGTADTTDADIIRQRHLNDFYDKIIDDETEAWKRLITYRIGDASEDTTVNSIDANAVTEQVKPLYYEPLPAALTDTMAQKAASDVPTPDATPPPDKATLTLDYLGKNVTTPKDAPQTPNISANNVYKYTGSDPAHPTPQEVVQSIVWVGIGIRNAQNLTHFYDGLYSAELAIDYDPDIFEPCHIEGYIRGEWGMTSEDIRQSLYSENINNASTTLDLAKWLNGTIDTGSFNLDLDTIESTDKENDSTVTTEYKTVHFTIKSTANDWRLKGIDASTDPDTTYYLARIPFRLKAYPEDTYTGLALKINIAEQTFALGAADDGVTEAASWEGDTDKTIPVLNAYNHFDTDIVDLFDTNETISVMGMVSGWNPQQPFVIQFFKLENLTETPDYEFKSDDDDGDGNLANGSLTIGADGYVWWNYELPVSNLFDYYMRITKLSHWQDADILVDPKTQNDGSDITIDDKELIVGDINQDGFIKIPDRVSLMRFFSQQKPWQLGLDEFEKVDLNGDDRVNLFDLNLLNKNISEGTGGGGSG